MAMLSDDSKFHVDEESVRATGLDLDALYVTGKFSALPVHMVVQRMLDQLNLTYREEDHPAKGGRSMLNGVLLDDPEFWIYPKP